ncbi:cysteine peptidase family C39 domain-containing protein [Enterococcus sp. AN402]|uniref:cysteine peptidase family C39 domain-containing protein n=1 Tax=Enterococcus sp. AN402 TaxID=3151386 RepID=UPI00345A33A2
MKKVKYIPSYEHSECALSCITMISQYFNKDVSLTKLREFYGVPQGGYSISQMAEENLSSGWVNMNDNRVQIKRKQFEKMDVI